VPGVKIRDFARGFDSRPQAPDNGHSPLKQVQSGLEKRQAAEVPPRVPDLEE